MTPQELLQEIEAVIATLPEDDQVLWMRFTINTTCVMYTRNGGVDCDWHINGLWSIWKSQDLFWVCSPNVGSHHKISVEAATKALVEHIRAEWPPAATEAQCKP